MVIGSVSQLLIAFTKTQHINLGFLGLTRFIFSKFRVPWCCPILRGACPFVPVRGGANGIGVDMEPICPGGWDVA